MCVRGSSCGSVWRPLPSGSLPQKRWVTCWCDGWNVAAIPLATSSDLEFAHMVAVRATEWATDAEAWRLRMDIARLHEDQKDAELCLRRLIELRPSDERLVLERLDLALSDRQTVESRLEGLDVILAEPLSGPLQARLWWRRALLRQGRGDGDWREDAANAVVADPSFSAPLAALVTPTLAQEKADPAEVIEALAALAAATPADADTAARLGRRLLRYGAYADAQAALMAAVSSAERMGQRPPPTLLADLFFVSGRGWPRGSSLCFGRTCHAIETCQSDADHS